MINKNLIIDPKTILVTGANGFIGLHLIHALVEKDYCIKAAVRNAAKIQCTSIDVIDADLSGSIDWTENLRDVTTVIHLAARVHKMNESSYDSLDAFRNINTRATLELAEQAAIVGVKRFIYLSTVAVNGSYTISGESFTESSQPCPKSAYAISKYESEQGLKKLSEQYPMEFVIIRPPMVYGAHAPGNFAKLVSIVQKGVPLPFGLTKNLRSFIYIDNLVSFIEACINNPAAGNNTFLISDSDDVSLFSMVEQISKNLEVRNNIFPVPLSVLGAFFILFRKRSLVNQLLKPMRIDISAAKKILKWMPPHSFSDGIRMTFKKNSKYPNGK